MRPAGLAHADMPSRLKLRGHPIVAAGGAPQDLVHGVGVGLGSGLVGGGHWMPELGGVPSGRITEPPYRADVHRGLVRELLDGGADGRRGRRRKVPDGRLPRSVATAHPTVVGEAAYIARADMPPRVILHPPPIIQIATRAPPGVVYGDGRPRRLLVAGTQVLEGGRRGRQAERTAAMLLSHQAGLRLLVAGTQVLEGGRRRCGARGVLAAVPCSGTT
jgi:hypothetical protein